MVDSMEDDPLPPLEIMVMVMMDWFAGDTFEPSMHIMKLRTLACLFVCCFFFFIYILLVIVFSLYKW